MCCLGFRKKEKAEKLKYMIYFEVSSTFSLFFSNETSLYLSLIGGNKPRILVLQFLDKFDLRDDCSCLPSVLYELEFKIKLMLCSEL